jgi:hypothetical protein
VGIKSNLKVGKTYKATRIDPPLSEDLNRRDEVSTTVKVISAKKAKVQLTGKLFFSSHPECEVNISATVKRKK